MSALPPGLLRCPDEHVVAGVCAGVARWLGVDPIVVRLAAVVLALANGVGVVAYLAAWLVLPEAPPSTAPTGAAGAARGAGPAVAPAGVAGNSGTSAAAGSAVGSVDGG
ncbi:MAG: PspC domain-containing protein [Acidimicrobiales bacterium]|nr:PspC domain-containing protein [Acidimicrobiales bacterium]